MSNAGTFALLTKEEAAKSARIGVRTLDKRLEEGRGPRVTKIGKRILFRADHLNEWIEDHALPARVA